MKLSAILIGPIGKAAGASLLAAFAAWTGGESVGKAKMARVHEAHLVQCDSTHRALERQVVVQTARAESLVHVIVLRNERALDERARLHESPPAPARVEKSDRHWLISAGAFALGLVIGHNFGPVAHTVVTTVVQQSQEHNSQDSHHQHQHNKRRRE